ARRIARRTAAPRSLEAKDRTSSVHSRAGEETRRERIDAQEHAGLWRSDARDWALRDLHRGSKRQQSFPQALHEDSGGALLHSESARGDRTPESEPRLGHDRPAVPIDGRVGAPRHRRPGLGEVLATIENAAGRARIERGDSPARPAPPARSRSEPRRARAGEGRGQRRGARGPRGGDRRDGRDEEARRSAPRVGAPADARTRRVASRDDPYGGPASGRGAADETQAASAPAPRGASRGARGGRHTQGGRDSRGSRGYLR